MTQKSVEMLLQDIQLVNEANHETVMAVRALVRRLFANVTEEVKYGGIMFTSGAPFAGVFAYKAHVSVEFGSGAQIIDTWGFLEGAGKGRRHIKLVSAAQIAEKQLAAYLPLALQAAQAASRAP